MGTALSTGGGLTQSQMEKAKALGIPPGEYKKQMMNAATNQGKKYRDESKPKPKKKYQGKLSFRKKQP